MPVLGDDKTMKKLGYKKVKSKGKTTYVKDVTVKKINLDKIDKKLSGGQAKLDKNNNNKIDAEDFKILKEGAFSGKMISKLSSDVIGRAFPKVKGQKQKEEEMYMREKARYEEPQNMRGGGIAIKGTKFKGVF